MEIPRCIFCLKISGNFTQEGNDNFHKRFLVLLERYLETKLYSSSDRINFCEDCEIVMNSFCHIYNEVVRMKMKLEWRILTLKNIMVYAGRVPSRVAQLRECYPDTVKGTELLNTVQGWRKRLIRLCTLKLSSRLPRVVLRKLINPVEDRSQDSHDDSFSTSCGSYFNELDEADNQLNQDLDNAASPIPIFKEELKTEKCTLIPAVIAVAANNYDPFSLETDPNHIETDISAVASVKYDLDCDKQLKNDIPDDTNSTLGLESSNPGTDRETENKTLSCEAIPEKRKNFRKLKAKKVDDITINLSRLRQRFPCQKCKRTFPNAEKLSVHQDMHDDAEKEMQISDRDVDDEVSVSDESDSSISKSYSDEWKNASSSGSEVEDLDDIDSNLCQGVTTSISTSTATPSAPEHLHQSSSPQSKSTAIAKDTANNNARNDDIEQIKPPTLSNNEQFPKENETVEIGILYEKAENKWIACDVCPTKFYNKNYYSLHFKIHHNLEGVSSNQVHKCDWDQCSAYFLTARQLSKHIWNHHKTDTPPECDMCKIKFICPKTYKEHYKTCHNRTNVKNCDIWWCKWDNTECSAYFLTKSQLKRHYQRCHPKRYGSRRRWVTCDVCPVKYGRQFGRSLLRHYETHHAITGVDSKDVHKCDQAQCSAYFLKSTQLRTHQLRYHYKDCPQKFSRKCNVCGNFLRSIRCRDLHWKSHHDVTDIDLSKVVRCKESQCNAYFLKRYQLDAHMLCRHGAIKKRPVTCCHICGKKVDSKYKRKHVKAYHNLKGVDPKDIYKCDVSPCSAYFLSEIQLDSHFRREHGSIGPMKECADCGKVFVDFRKLRMHRRYMHRAQIKLNFACDFEGCYRKFDTQIGLINHFTMKHKSNSLFKDLPCPKCGKICKGAGFLKQHMKRMHENRKRGNEYVCEQCGKSFMLKDALNQHCLVHSGPDSWEFQCSTCGKKCMTKQKLEEHNRTHTKEKPFICQFCGEKYAHKHNLRNHVNSKHADIAKDVPRAFNKRNLTSRKGIQRKV